MQGTGSARASRALALLGATALIGGAAGCGNSSSDDAPTSSDTAAPTGAAPAKSAQPQIGKGLTIGFVSITNCGNPTICAVEKGFTAEARALGANAKVLEAGASANPVDASITNMDQMISQKVDALGVWPADEGSISAPAHRAAAAKIPVFAYDVYNTKVGPGTNIVSSVNQGRELQAKQAADALCASHRDGGPVLAGEYGVPLPSITFLLNKFKSYLQACSGGKLRVVNTFANKTDDVSGGRAGAEPAIQGNGSVVGIENYNDATAIGASQAAQELGKRNQIWIAGYNLASDGVQALKTGRIDASWDYQPVVAGQILARQMIEYLAKKQTPQPFTMVWPRCYTQGTIGQLVPQDKQLAQVAAGQDLAAGAKSYIEEGDAIPAPPASLPGCSRK